MKPILALDVDGTVCDSVGELYPSAAAIIPVLADQGWLIALCSARPLSSLLDVGTRMLDRVGIVSAFQGALCVRVRGSGTARTCEAIWKDGVSPDRAREVRELVLGLGASTVWTYTEFDWIVDKPAGPLERRESAITRSEWTRDAHVDDIQTDVFKILGIVDPPNPRREDSIVDGLAQLQVSAYRSQPGYIEIVAGAGSLDKGLARIRQLSHGRGVVAIGDGLNDVGMLRESDVGLTFLDAPDDLKAVAAYVLPAARNDAWMRALSLLPDLGPLAQGACT